MAEQTEIDGATLRQEQYGQEQDGREQDGRQQDGQEQQVALREFHVGGTRPVCTAALVRQGAGSGLEFERQTSNVSAGVWHSVKSAFMPEGYPNSVTDDYLPFQIWDTLQGLSTYIRSMLSTQALLGGIGVGETKATVVGATFQWFLRDFTGMLGGILFTLFQGSKLDGNAKQWRLAADLMNDMAMLMDLISPLFPGAFLAILCMGSIARAITGTASGATRAALTQHFALRQNAADIQAKEGSQETAATMMGMLLGIFVARATAGHAVAMWISFLALTAFHMYANYRAVRSLCLKTLNPERTEILLNSFLRRSKVPTPEEMAPKERVLPQLSMQDSLGIWRTNKPWRICLGSRISDVRPQEGWESFLGASNHSFFNRSYLLFPIERTVHIILSKRSSMEDCLQAYIHALHLRGLLQEIQASSTPDFAPMEAKSSDWMESSYKKFIQELGTSGWVFDRVHIPVCDWRAEWSEWSPKDRTNTSSGRVADRWPRQTVAYKVD